MLLKLLLSLTDDFARVVKKNRTGAGSALVEREYVLRIAHGVILLAIIADLPTLKQDY